MLDAFDEFFELAAFAFGEEGDGGAFDGGVADADNFFIGEVGDEADAAGGIDFEVSSETGRRGRRRRCH